MPILVYSDVPWRFSFKRYCSFSVWVLNFGLMRSVTPDGSVMISLLGIV